MTGDYILYQNPGWDSAIVEAQLDSDGQPKWLVAVGDIFLDDSARPELAAFIARNFP